MAKGYHSGYDIKTPSAGHQGTMYCDVCKEEMGFEPNVKGATSRGEAMAGKSHVYDRYTCKNAGENWHNQIISLLKEIDRNPSVLLGNIMKKEIKGILKNKKATKITYGW